LRALHAVPSLVLLLQSRREDKLAMALVDTLLYVAQGDCIH
jgi:hypothetical protein